MSLDSILRLIIVCILPCLFAFTCWTTAPENKTSIRKSNNTSVFTLYCIIVLLLAFTPATYFDGSDKGRYMYAFDHILSANVNELTKDIGWHYFVKFSYYITFGISQLFFLITAVIFAGSFYYFAKKKFGIEYTGYFLLLTVGMLGFSSYTNNVIRNGIAVACCVYSLAIDKKYINILLLIVAYFIHGSAMILIVSYLATLPLKTTKLPTLFWILCLVLSIGRIDFSQFFQLLGILDDRIMEYTIGANEDILAVYSKAGMFRWDFLIYSIFPLYVARLWITKYNYEDVFYIRIVNMYLLCNALWILLIRQAYCDRFAFLSWLMIPIVTLYPLLKQEVIVSNPEKKSYLIITIITGVNASLALLAIL